MPPRRLRISPRVVKRAISKYNARGKVDRATYKATIDIAILTADLTPKTGLNLLALRLARGPDGKERGGPNGPPRARSGCNSGVRFA